MSHPLHFDCPTCKSVQWRGCLNLNESPYLPYPMLIFHNARIASAERFEHGVFLKENVIHAATAA